MEFQGAIDGTAMKSMIGVSRCDRSLVVLCMSFWGVLSIMIPLKRNRFNAQQDLMTVTPSCSPLMVIWWHDLGTMFHRRGRNTFSQRKRI